MSRRNAAPAPRALLVIAASVASVLAGCAASPRTLVAPDVQVVAVALLDVAADSQRFRVDLNVMNTNDVRIPIERISFSMRFAGAGVMRGSSVEPFTLEPGGSRAVEFDVTTDLVSSVSRLLALLQGPDDAIAYDIDGMVTLSRGFRPTFPFSRRGEIPLAMPAGLR